MRRCREALQQYERRYRVETAGFEAHLAAEVRQGDDLE
jgi:hypothetical protein